MRETQRNIKRYKEQLGDVKYKIFSVGIMFVISICMLTTASFAWVTLSSAPEVKNIDTTLVGNGSLEIALAHGDENGNIVLPSKPGTQDGQLDLVSRNLTWGNLINLNDKHYGLHALNLKPATLNDSDLLFEPLQAVEYGSDGRVTYPLKEFRYSSYDPNADAGQGAFIINTINKYGVRAISSVKETTLQDQDDIEKLEILEGNINEARTLYRILVSTDSKVNPKGYINVVSDLMGVYLTERMGGDTGNYVSYIKTLKEMMIDFTGCLDAVAVFYTNSANIQLLESNPNSIPQFTVETLLNTNEAELKRNGIAIMEGFDELKKDISDFAGHFATIEKLYDEIYPKDSTVTARTNVTWSEIKNVVNFMVDIENTIVNQGKSTEYKVSNIGKTAAMNIMNNKDLPNTGTITAGVLKRYEQYTGEKMYAANLEIKAKYIINVSLNADVFTNAAGPYTLNTVVDSIESMFNGANVQKVAGDVYGMAIDFWLRTNDSNSFVTLEGKPEIELVADKTKEGYIIYLTNDGSKIYHKPSGNVSTPSHELLSSLESGEASFTDHNSHLSTGDFYNFSTGTKLEFLDPTTGENDPELRSDFVNTISGYSVTKNIVGYDGVNRVWQEGVEEDNATQGQGSCFIFYPTDPLDKDKKLTLLDAFTVVFMDEYGVVLAKAELNTKYAYESLGKVIVPLELVEGSKTETNYNGDTVKVITALEDSTPKYVSAIIYMEGENISNVDVDAINDIVGYLNLQFGSTIDLNNYDDEDLKSDVITVDASVSNNTFTFDATNLPTTTLTANVNGTKPGKVEARFARLLNDSQVALEDFVTLAKQTDGSYKVDVTFNRPGKYILRSIWVDGIEYDLIEPINIEISGFNINSVTWLFDGDLTNADNEVYKMVSGKSMNTTIDLSFSGTYIPKSVQGVIISDNNGKQTIDFYKGSADKWSASVSFNKSDKYTFDTLIIDSEVYLLSEEQQKLLTLHLGVHTLISFDENEFTFDVDNPSINVAIDAQILDENNKAIKSLSEVYLQYNSTSSIDYKNELLKWNSSSQTYEGNYNFNTYGEFEFGFMIINGNKIKNGTGVNIVIIPPDPPEYITNSGSSKVEAYVYKPNDNASLSVEIKNTDAAAVAAVMVNTETGASYIVDGTGGIKDSNNVRKWTFVIPQQTDRSQNGEWTLTNIYVSNVFVDDVMYKKPTGSKWTDSGVTYLNWNVSSTNNSYEDNLIKTYVVNDIKVDVTHKGHDEYTPYGKQETSKDFEGVFTDSLDGKYTISGYDISVTDYDGKTLNTNVISISDVNLKYNHSTKPEWWTNSENTIDKAKQNPTINISAGDEGLFNSLDKSTLGFYYAGVYTPQFNIKINNTAISIYGDGKEPNNIIVNNFVKSENVIWVQPEVNWVSISPDSSRTLFIDYEVYNAGKWYSPDYRIKANKSVKNSISHSDNNIDVYIYMKDGSTYWYSGYEMFINNYGIVYSAYADFVPTNATAKILNSGDFDSASCTIDNSDGSDITFSFSANSLNDTKAIGQGSTSGHTWKKVASGSKAETVSIIIKNDKNENVEYVFKIVKPLMVNKNNKTEY